MLLPISRQSKAIGACSRWSGMPNPAVSLTAITPPPSDSSLHSTRPVSCCGYMGANKPMRMHCWCLLPQVACCTFKSAHLQRACTVSRRPATQHGSNALQARKKGRPRSKRVAPYRAASSLSAGLQLAGAFSASSISTCPAGANVRSGDSAMHMLVQLSAERLPTSCA